MYILHRKISDKQLRIKLTSKENLLQVLVHENHLEKKAELRTWQEHNYDLTSYSDHSYTLAQTRATS